MAAAARMLRTSRSFFDVTRGRHTSHFNGCSQWPDFHFQFPFSTPMGMLAPVVFLFMDAHEETASRTEGEIGMRKVALCALMAASLLGACSTHQVPMTYDPAAVQRPPLAKPNVEVLAVTDARKYTGKHLGAIRGGYGNALKTIEASGPVKDVVHKAFEDALNARGLLASTDGGGYGLDITVEKLDCSQLIRKEAHARFRVTVLEKGTGQPVYSKVVEDNREGAGNPFITGVFGSVEELRKMANDSMQAAIDQAIDNPAFLTVVRAR
ncbi:hypothetical protein [Azospirillum brasilense]|nr:hypothetical protein [Azospirillum brasilense]NUB31823.1 hypothetical protein [Azospirillum brasilense]